MINIESISDSLRNIRGVSKIEFTGMENLSPDELKAIGTLFFQNEDEAQAYFDSEWGKARNNLIKRKIEGLPHIDNLDSKIENPLKLTIEDIKGIQEYFSLPDCEMVGFIWPQLWETDMIMIRNTIQYCNLITDVLLYRAMEKGFNEDEQFYLYLLSLDDLMNGVREGIDKITKQKAYHVSD